MEISIQRLCFDNNYYNLNVVQLAVYSYDRRLQFCKRFENNFQSIYSGVETQINELESVPLFDFLKYSLQAISKLQFLNFDLSLM